MLDTTRYGSILVLLILGCSQANAQSVAPTVNTESTEPQVAGSPGRETFTEKAEAEVKEWGARLNAFGGRALEKGEAAGSRTDQDLHAAWAETLEATHQLRIASAQGWQNAKAYYERKSHDLEGAWHRAHPT